MSAFLFWFLGWFLDRLCESLWTVPGLFALKRMMILWFIFLLLLVWLDVPCKRLSWCTLETDWSGGARTLSHTDLEQFQGCMLTVSWPFVLLHICKCQQYSLCCNVMNYYQFVKVCFKFISFIYFQTHNRHFKVIKKCAYSVLFTVLRDHLYSSRFLFRRFY